MAEPSIIDGIEGIGDEVASHGVVTSHRKGGSEKGSETGCRGGGGSSVGSGSGRADGGSITGRNDNGRDLGSVSRSSFSFACHPAGTSLAVSVSVGMPLDAIAMIGAVAKIPSFVVPRL